MRYQNNYLTAVVVRIDFPPIYAAGAADRPELSRQIERHFPQVLAKPSTTVTVAVGPDGTSFNQSAAGLAFEHTRSVLEQYPRITLAADSLLIEYGKEYKHSNVFYTQITDIFTALARLYPELFVGRIGLRYVNEFVFAEGHALDWANLIKKPLVDACQAALLPEMRLARAMNQVQSFDDDVTLLVHYGFFNPSFPGELVRKHFVLDIDAFKEGGLAVGDLPHCLTALNRKCDLMFEASIEDGLRDLMGVLNEAA